MLDRRHMLAGAAASLGLAATASAQVMPPAGYASPAGTSPFPPEVFRARRQRVMDGFKTGVAVVYSDDQPEDFAWLTGVVDEPGAILILAPGEREMREALLIAPRDYERERWDVERLPLGTELERRTGFRYVFRTPRLSQYVMPIAGRTRELRFLGPIAAIDAPIPKALELYGKISQRIPGCAIRDDSALLPAMRVVKEPRELDLIRKATAATGAGHRAAMKAVRPGMTEAQLRDILEAGFRAGGGDGLSYESIVASGRNAAYLHYTRGTATIRDGDLILIDAAASVKGYRCDVTRTFPASGKFTPQQRSVYELVLEAQLAAESKLRAGVRFDEWYKAGQDVLRKAGRLDDSYHGIGHFVGLHVHDVGDLSKPIPAGAVLTIEPGQYVQGENYGIRIEDMYLITETGAERLSKDVPRTVAEVEAIMRR